MNNQSKYMEKIRERYNKMAENEDSLSCGGAINFAEISKGEICADFGCGRGNDAIKLASLTGKKGFVYGIDVSERMVTEAKKNTMKNGTGNIEIIYSEQGDIPLENRSVDVIISNCTINHVPDKMSLWNEIYRILKKNGRFIVSDIYSIKEIPEKYCKDPDAVAQCWAGAVTREEYLNTIERAGFVNIQILEESRPYARGYAEIASFTIRGYKT